MLDKKTELMLKLASTLTAEELDDIRASATSGEDGSVGTMVVEDEDPASTQKPLPPDVQEDAENDSTCDSGAASTRGKYERSRTRESKVSTGCLGKPREAHEWWPIGTELIGEIGSENFTAVVVENPRVKSGCSVQITSGAAKNRVCLTPTRAAIEATEDFRQAHNLGRGGGITNGWTFWKPTS